MSHLMPQKKTTRTKQHGFQFTSCGDCEEWEQFPESSIVDTSNEVAEIIDRGIVPRSDLINITSSTTSSAESSKPMGAYAAYRLSMEFAAKSPHRIPFDEFKIETTDSSIQAEYAESVEPSGPNAFYEQARRDFEKDQQRRDGDNFDQA